MLIISKDYFSQRFEIECHAINQIETFCLHTLKIHKANWAAVICYIRIYLRRAVYSVCIDLQCDHSLYECLLFSGDCYFMAIHSWQNRNCNRAHFIYGFIDVVKIKTAQQTLLNVETTHSFTHSLIHSLGRADTRQNSHYESSIEFDWITRQYMCVQPTVNRWQTAIYVRFRLSSGFDIWYDILRENALTFQCSWQKYVPFNLSWLILCVCVLLCVLWNRLLHFKTPIFNVWNLKPVIAFSSKWQYICH